MDENAVSASPFLAVDDSSRASEEMLEGEPVPFSVLVRLAAWESKNLWKLSWASIVITMFNFMLSLATQMFMGHVSALDLAGASIANVGIQGLAYGIMVTPRYCILRESTNFQNLNSCFYALLQLGMASALQTVCGQAYGAKRYSEMGIFCQRALILQFVAALILSILYWFSGPFFELIGQSADVSLRGQLYARGLIPQLIAFSLYCPMQRFLQAQNIVNPMAYMAVGVLVLHLLLSWIVVFVLNCGLLGAALTLSLSWWILVVLTWLCIAWSPSCKQSWTGLSVEAFRGLWPYFKLTMASAIMLVYVTSVWFEFVKRSTFMGEN